MKRDFGKLADNTFDVVIIGGGIIGTGIARDAALRGLKTLLVEKNDFAAGTTSRSTRLIHGGFRYLEHLEFGLVREDMREREILLKIAPHLVTPLPFLIPLTKPRDRLVMSLGTLVYDILSFDKSLPGRKHYSREITRKMEPNLQLPGLRGSDQYYDCQLWFTERLNLENAIAAVENNAIALNHAKVTGLLKNEHAVTGVELQDTITGNSYRVKSRMVINAAGHWMDSIYNMVDVHQKPILRRTKGVHLLTSRISNNALVLFAKSDGRLWFVIPWHNYSLIGTTDTDYKGNLEEVYADDDDVNYILSEAQRTFPNLKKEDIFYTHAGLRSLLHTGDTKPSNVSRAHLVIDHEKSDNIQGFISIIGGKITAYRGISEEITDIICNKLHFRAMCTTSHTPLPGAPAVTPEQIQQYTQEFNLDADTVAHLASLYGTRCSRILEMTHKDPRGRQTLCPHSHDILAQIWYAIEEESAITLSDFMFRRGSLGLAQCQGLDAIEVVAAEMARVMGWNPDEQQRQIADFRYVVSLSQRYKLRNESANS